MVVLSEILSKGSSSSSSPHDHRYDVFLSFRGADTRNGFADHLYHALNDANLQTFLDDEEIPTGEELKPELENAIKASRASIVVLSENYASSMWCLEELVLILEQHTKFNQIVIPIFYHVEPTHVRKQESTFGDAMAKHKQRMKTEENLEKRSQLVQKMELWKKALTQVADLKGKDARNRKETEFIEEIVTDIHSRLGVSLRNTLPLLIGMDYWIKFITSWLTDGSCHATDILTVLGMSGIGKTSLAKYVFGLNCSTFQRSSFLEGISRRCTEQSNGLLDLQKQLCEDISINKPLQLRDVYVYTSMIENLLACKKVFLVLDDIENLDQLDALLGKKGFHPGSKIIITTKDASLTERCALFNPQVQLKHTKVLLKGLYETESLELLCIHAFKCQKPKEDYKEVSKKLVSYCDGHPLALEVLGKSLHNRDVSEWENYIAGLKKEPHSRIKKALQMSFDSLPSKNDKDLFKHIACFFVGKDRYLMETILEACDINTRTGIMNLSDRCLVSIGGYNELMMHQLIQEMGRDVVRQESPEKPWKRSRLWCHEESYKVLKQKKGNENLLGLTLDMRILEKNKLCKSFELKTDALSKMDNLMILHLNYVQMNGSYENFPEELRWLCIHGFPLKSIPSDLPMENLVVLDMSYSKIESFDISHSNPEPPAKRLKLTGSCSKDKRLLGCLKILDLSCCYELRSLSGFCEFPALEKLILTNCMSLIQICASIEQCHELVFIDLSYCNSFRKLLRAIDKLKNVKTLLLNGCSLGGLPFVERDYDSLSANSNGINSQASSMAIVEAIPGDWKSLSISLPSSLVRLSLKSNNLSNESFPMDFSCLSVLKDLLLNCNPIVSLPNCVRSLPRLETLNMSHCKKLMSIEHPPRTLRQLVIWSDVSQRNSKHLLQKVVFDPEMSLPSSFLVGSSSIEIEGMVKIEPMACVEGKLLSSLGWSNVMAIIKSRLGTYNLFGESDGLHVQMYYEFGIFSTIYEGKAMPKLISHKSKGSSLSFTIPSSPNQLRGFNIGYVQKSGTSAAPNYHSFRFPAIIISNVTKNRTWIYHHCIHALQCAEEYLVLLSHWMFGVIEMEGGDNITITLKELDDIVMEQPNQLTIECGISFVYDDGNAKGDTLAYYKSWNNFVDGDLSAFQSRSGEYILRNKRFSWSCMTVLKHTIYNNKFKT